ncbi:hypothetical protein FN846DRAFT_976946, partial [Sphaerosporella brunnea]
THSMPAHLLHSGTSSNSSGSPAEAPAACCRAGPAAPPRKRLPPLLRLARAYSARGARGPRRLRRLAPSPPSPSTEDCLFALEAGAKVWRRDRSAPRALAPRLGAHASPRFLAEMIMSPMRSGGCCGALRRARACVCCAVSPPPPIFRGNPFWMPERGVAYVGSLRRKRGTRAAAAASRGQPAAAAAGRSRGGVYRTPRGRKGWCGGSPVMVVDAILYAIRNFPLKTS